MATMTSAPSPEVTRLIAEIRAEMARKDIKGTELARRLGEPNSTVHRWIKRGQGLDMEAVLAIGRVLDVTPEELMRRSHFAWSVSGSGRVA